ncbi:hypothetical protein [Allomuricauda sp. R78024]|uniref:hypothetical protein n=1 Tax=Allomuricauda sp. R78024 TaxID=3093867 RepID=UPI0037C651CA
MKKLGEMLENQIKEIVYIKLLDDGTPVWRPTIGVRLENGIYKIQKTENYDSLDEKWEFKPGSVVRCKFINISGESCLTATEELN